MNESRQASGFELSRGFDAGPGEGGLELGPLFTQYRELFADALLDGVITLEERKRLNEAAKHLGMSGEQLQKLEQAMVNAYEMHHRVKVAVQDQPAVAGRTLASVDAQLAPREQLLVEIQRLNERIRMLEEELREARSHVSIEVDLTGLAAAESVTEDSPAELCARIRRDPTNPELFDRLYETCREAGDRDLQFRAAQALVVLGAADSARAAFAAEHQPSGLIAPARALSASDWHAALTHPEFETVTGHILSSITPAALMGRVAALTHEGRIAKPPESQRQDPKTSTVMAVRALAWAAKVLGMPTPAIYADAERDIGFAHVLDVPPCSVVGKAALAGRTQTENAFLAARHMTAYRAEFFVKVLCPSLSDLEDLFLAALLVGSPGLPLAAHVRARVEPISSALAAMLDAERRDALRAQFKAFVADGGRTNLLCWSDSIDKTACRAGLLLCGDLACAARLLAHEEGPEGPLRADLLAFTVSDRHTQLRRRLGVALT